MMVVLSAYSYPDKGSPVWYIPELAEGSELVRRLNPNDQNAVELVAGKHIGFVVCSDHWLCDDCTKCTVYKHFRIGAS